MVERTAFRNTSTPRNGRASVPASLAFVVAALCIAAALPSLAATYYKVGSRHVPRKVIGWTAGTGPANVNFVLDDAVGRLTVESDGVYRHTGLVIIVK